MIAWRARRDALHVGVQVRVQRLRDSALTQDFLLSKIEYVQAPLP
jgi:hypothetical protein